ncbi:hypothetical protein D3C84_858240 [compost metagenome]
MRQSAPTSGKPLTGISTLDQHFQQPLMQTVHLVVVSLFRSRLHPKQMQLHQPGWRRIIAVTQARQPHQPITLLTLTPDLRQSGGDLLCNCIRPCSSAEDDSGPGRAAWCAATPLHDRCHWATHATTFAIKPKLLTPVLQQYFHCLDHRPTPPKTEPDTKSTHPDTNPTQTKSFKINSFNRVVFSVLGLLGISVLA